MYNDYYLLKRVQEEEGAISYATVQDSFSYLGEVVKTPIGYNDKEAWPHIGDKVLFLKGSGEDVKLYGDSFKVVKLEDIIMPYEKI